MAGKSDYLEEALLRLIFNRTTNAALFPGAGSATYFHMALYNVTPPSQFLDNNTPYAYELSYSGYARQTVYRNTTDFTVTGNIVTLNRDIEFPRATSVPTPADPYAKVTHWSLMYYTAGYFMYFGELNPVITMSVGDIIVVPAGTVIATED